MGGGYFFHLKSYSFGKLVPHEKFHNPRITPSTRKVCVGGWVVVVFEGKFSVSFGPNLEPGILALGLDQAEQKM